VAGSADYQELVARCLRGDSKAWSELFRANFRHAEIVALAPPFRFHAHEAEDIAQETMIELARKLAQIENIPAFVGTVAHNKCVDRVRKMKPVLESDLPRGDDGDEPGLDQFAGAAPLPMELADNEAFSLLLGAVETLGEPCRAILHNRFFEELAYKDIAERLSIPAPQVGVYLARCLNRVRTQIEQRPDVWKELEALL
jgi:RNA polymerase sigma factor (sigma-70 family)